MGFVDEYCWNCEHFEVCKYYKKIKESGLDEIMSGCKYFKKRGE